MSRTNFSFKSGLSLLAVAALALAAGCSTVDLDDEYEYKYSNKDELGNRPARKPEKTVANDNVQTIDATAYTYTGAGPAGVGDTVYFDYDSFLIPQNYRGDIEAHASHMMVDGTRQMVIEGHTDERGGSEYNLALGQKRADAVKKALTLLGASEGAIETISYGEEKPANLGQSESAWAENRRAQMIYR